MRTHLSYLVVISRGGARPLISAAVILPPPQPCSCIPNLEVVLLCSARKVAGGRSDIKKSRTVKRTRTHLGSPRGQGFCRRARDRDARGRTRPRPVGRPTWESRDARTDTADECGRGIARGEADTARGRDRTTRGQTRGRLARCPPRAGVSSSTSSIYDVMPLTGGGPGERDPGCFLQN